MLGLDHLGAQPSRQTNRATRQVMERHRRQGSAVGRLLATTSTPRSHDRLQRRQEPLLGDPEFTEHITCDRRLPANRQQQMLTTEPMVALLASL